MSRRVEGDIHRYTYKDLAARSRRMAKALAALGVKMSDRVATLAWNGYRHMELYYAVSGTGAVLHTVNPRLHPDQIVYIADHAEDQVLFFDLTFLPLIQAVAHRTKTIKAFVAMTDRAHMPAADVAAKIPNLLCYEELLDAQDDRFAWPEFDENTASSLCYTSGTTGNPKGVLYSHRSTVLHAYAAAHARRAELLGARQHPAGGADVPRQRLEPALRRLHDGRQARLPRRRARRQVAVRTVRERRRHAVGRRAHGVAGAAGLRRGQRPEVQHHEPHGDRRLGLPAGDDPHLRRQVRRARAARLGHDGDEPAGHRLHLQAQAPGA